MDLQEIGKQPISADNPAGEDVRYEPEFEELQQEIDKLSIASSTSQGIDWERVVTLSSSILSEKSKNILVAVYLGQALNQTRQLAGLELGATILADLTENFWEKLYPPKKRRRGRINALKWWYDHTDKFLSNLAPDPIEPQAMENIRQALQRLDKVWAEADEDAPILRPLLAYLDRFPLQQPTAAAAEEPAPESKSDEVADSPEPKEQDTVSPPATSEASSQAPPAPRPETSPQSIPSVSSSPRIIQGEEDPKKIKKALANCFDDLGRIAEYQLKTNPANPMPYRLLRLKAWLDIDMLPPSENNKTMLPAPDSMVRTAIENLFQAGELEQTVAAAESRVPQFLFWLDMSRISARALERLGEGYMQARQALSAETALYVSRLPGIENLQFADGTPFADRETKLWLKEIRLDQTSGAESCTAEGASTDQEVTDTLNKARDLYKQNKLGAALQLLQSGFDSQASGLSRFTWRLALINLLGLSGRPDLSRPHVQKIMDDIDKFSLEQWDFKLAVKGLVACYEVLSATDDQEQSREIYSRIAALSPLTALNLV